MKANQRGFHLHQRSINSLLKACPYSFPANKLGYCGPRESWQSFLEFISSPSQHRAAIAKNKLKDFYALHSYLQLIADANQMQPFDPAVVEAYWIGNRLLENVQYTEMQKTILSFQLHGLPRSIAEKKAAGLPDNILPHHSMHVLYVNFISPKVKPIIGNLSNCLVQWAQVKSISAKGVRVKGIELLFEGSELKLKERIKTVQNPFNLQLKPGDFISVHWNSAIEKISRTELNNLGKFTEQTLRAIKP